MYSTTTEYLSLDQITGEPLVTKTTDMNGGITLSRKLPAFRVASYTAMSPKAIRSTYKNIVSADFSSKLLKDTVFSSNGDFASYNINTYKRNFKQRKFDNSSKYIHSSITNSNWVSDKNYSWQGPVGKYGLYKSYQQQMAF